MLGGGTRGKNFVQAVIWVSPGRSYEFDDGRDINKLPLNETINNFRGRPCWAQETLERMGVSDFGAFVVQEPSNVIVRKKSIIQRESGKDWANGSGVELYDKMGSGATGNEEFQWELASFYSF